MTEIIISSKRKTHCKHGHEFTPENTRIYVYKDTGCVKRTCKTCHYFGVRKSLAKMTPERREDYLTKQRVYHSKNWRKLIKKDPIKDSARGAVTQAIFYGKLKKEPCKDCGDVKAEFHHTHGYEWENRFTGVWLCRKHHAAEHRRLRWEAK